MYFRAALASAAEAAFTLDATSVAQAAGLGGERQGGLFRDRQGVHVAAHGHHGTGLGTAQDSQDAGPPDTRPDLQAEGPETVGDEGRCSRLLERELGVFVDVAAEGDKARGHFGREGGDLLIERPGLLRGRNHRGQRQDDKSGGKTAKSIHDRSFH